MFTDFTDLNKCCPKEDFQMSRVDKVVDSTLGCETMALLDSFSGYHQIWLRKEDEEKQVLLHLPAHIVISGCPKVSKMPALYSVG
jgi:hypothetical protein